MTTLVAQGILPSPKTSPALYEQRQKLERAKMGDMLRAKIARRPDRSELVHRHILEDVRPQVDPSLYNMQRQLKRAKLADTLSNQLQARPGPLELVAKNILHVVEDGDETSVDSVRDKNKTLSVSSAESMQSSIFGDIERIPLPDFTPTNYGLPACQVVVPHKYTNDEDSSSDVSGVLSPPDVFSSISDSPRGFVDGASPSTPNSYCQSQQMSPPCVYNDSSALPTSKFIKQVLLSSSVTKSESHDAIFSSNNQDFNAKTSKSSAQISSSILRPQDSAGIKQHKRRASAADATIFVAPSPPTNVGLANSGVLSGQSSSSQSPCPSPAAAHSGSTRPISLQLVSSPTAQSRPYSQRGAPGKDQTNRRKSAKGKKGGHTGSACSGAVGIGGKQKVIKFHEYKVIMRLLL